MKGLILAAVLCAFFAAPATGNMVNLVANGSFEEGVGIRGDPYNFNELPAGSTAITDWTITGSGSRVADYIGLRFETPYGDRSVDLDGYYTGQIGHASIEQVIADTVLGSAYQVTFAMAGNPEGGPSLKTMVVSAGNIVQQPFSFDTTGHTMQNMGWTTMGFTFTALGPSTTLSFQSTTDGSPIGYGPVLDNVSVVAVPLPASILLGVFAVGLAGQKLRKFV